MQDEKLLIKSTVEGVKFENTGSEIVIRFDTQERIDSRELNLVWDEFMFWTKALSGSKCNGTGAGAG
jgi:hypothetical protein